MANAFDADWSEDDEWDVDDFLDADWSEEFCGFMFSLVGTDGWDVDDFLDLWEKEHACLEDDDGWFSEENGLCFRMPDEEWIVSDEHLRLLRSAAQGTGETKNPRKHRRSRDAFEVFETTPLMDEPAHKNPRVLQPLPAVKAGVRKGKKPAQAELFREFLEEEERRGVVRLHRGAGEEAESPIGVAGWDVENLQKWWEDAKVWFEDEPGTWTESAFFMALRRIGFRALNEALHPASAGYDFGLRRTDVARHGYVFDAAVLERYNKMLWRRIQLKQASLQPPSSSVAPASPAAPSPVPSVALHAGSPSEPAELSPCADVVPVTLRGLGP